MTEMSLSPSGQGSSTEAGTVHAFIDTSPATGNQTCSIGSGGNKGCAAAVIMLNGTAPFSEVDTSVLTSAAYTNGTVTLSLGGETSFCAFGWMAGRADIADVSPKTGWTSDHEYGLGNQTLGIYSYDTIASTDVEAGADTIGGPDDFVLLAVAVKEAAGTSIPIFQNYYRQQS